MLPILMGVNDICDNNMEKSKGFAIVVIAEMCYLDSMNIAKVHKERILFFGVGVLTLNSR